MNGSAGSPGSFCFGRQQRLLLPAQFAEAFAARRVLRGDHFALHYRSNGLPGARLGLVIPKKQARTAVLRNTIKRQAREAFRLSRNSLPPADLVLRLARVPVWDGPAGKAAMRAEIVALFAELGRKEIR